MRTESVLAVGVFLTAALGALVLMACASSPGGDESTWATFAMTYEGHTINFGWVNDEPYTTNQRVRGTIEYEDDRHWRQVMRSDGVRGDRGLEFADSILRRLRSGEVIAEERLDGVALPVGELFTHPLAREAIDESVWARTGEGWTRSVNSEVDCREDDVMDSLECFLAEGPTAIIEIAVTRDEHGIPTRFVKRVGDTVVVEMRSTSLTVE